MGGLEKKLKHYLLFASFSLSIEEVNRTIFFLNYLAMGGLEKKLKWTFWDK